METTDQETATRTSNESHGQSRWGTAVGGLPDTDRTRQVLVVGDGVPGLALAAFLERSGHESTLVQTPASQTESQVRTVWPPGMRLLDEIDAADHVREHGEPLETVDVASMASDGGHDTVLSVNADHPTPVVATSETVREALRSRIEPATTVLSTAVAAVTPHDASVEVEFQNGVGEHFDLVAGADGAPSPLRATFDGEPQETEAFTQIEIPLCETPDIDRRPSDVWLDDAVQQYLPAPSGCLEGFLRLTAHGAGRDPSALASNLDGSMGSLPEMATDPDGSDAGANLATDVHHATGTSADWGEGRIAYCGPAACPVAPATGIQTALGLEDAWVLADELVRGSGRTAAVVERYGQRRRRRIRTLHRRASAADAHHDYPIGDAEPQRSLTRLRATTLASFCSGSLAELQQDVPHRL